MKNSKNTFLNLKIQNDSKYFFFDSKTGNPFISCGMFLSSTSLLKGYNNL